MSADPLYVATHHKCASVWLHTYLKQYCDLNGMEMFSTPHSFELSSNPPAVNVLLNASSDFVKSKSLKGIHVIRNPLDIIVSAYFSHRNTHPLLGWPELEAQRRVLCSVSEPEGLLLTLSFIERDDFYKGAEGPLHALRHWDFDDPGFITLRMEDLVADPGGTIGRMLSARYPDRRLPDESLFTFTKFAGRPPGDIDSKSHYRSGQRDQWRTVLPPSAIAYVRAHFRPLLERYYPASLANV